MKNVLVDEKVLSILPEFRVISLRVEGLAHSGERFVEDFAAAAFQKRSEEWKRLNPSEIPEIIEWKSIFKRFPAPSGACSSIENLIRRVRSGKFPPRIHPWVDLGNAISVVHGIPMGCEDSEKLVPFPTSMIRVSVAAGSEVAVPLGRPKAVEHPLPGEWIHHDAKGVVCRALNWRECHRTLVTASTREAIYTSEVTTRRDEDRALRGFEELREILRSQFGAQTGSIEWS